LPGCPECGRDIFVHDRKTGRTERVSVSSRGEQANGNSAGPSISADGRYVAFGSGASNLVKGDTNGRTDVFVRDWLKGKTERVSVRSDGSQVAEGGFSDSLSASFISEDGRFVAFVSSGTDLVPGDTNGVTDVFLRDRKLGTTERVSLGPHRRQANAGSLSPVLSPDGRFVAFESDATNLVPGDTNELSDIFVRDRPNGTTGLVNVGPHRRQADNFSHDPAISENGRFVAFWSWATNLIQHDTNGQIDVFVRSR
jgi:hypothetical protein